MITFTSDGQADVHFDLLNAQGSERRQEVRMPLADYIALVKASRTLEELRVLLLEWHSKNRETKAAVAAGSEGVKR